MPITPRAPIETVEVSVFRIPTDAPESDGTLEWDSTTLVVVHLTAAGARGVGYTYADTGTARLIHDKLGDVLRGRDAIDIPGAFAAMLVALRNLGNAGICATAVSACDVALWDLKGRVLGLSVDTLLGRARERVPVYGSGGFTSYSVERLREQLGGWAAEGIARVKMKVGRDAARDSERVAAARAAIGASTELFVDANGAYSAKQALALAQRFAEHDVRWFEEPVSSDHLEQLRLLRERLPPGMDLAAGEYGYEPFYFRRMLAEGAVDVLQADASRCGGITGFLHVASLCAAYGIPLSAHCAPTLHAAVCCAAPAVRHVEYFHDHVRIEHSLFDGAARAKHGSIAPDRDRPGLGIEFKPSDAARFAV